MKKPEIFQAGQQLYYVPRHGPCRHVTITKIGRIWLTCGRKLRINKKNLHADGGEYTSPGRCYLSQRAYADETYLYNQWRTLSTQIQNASWRQFNIVQIREVSKILGLGFKEDNDEQPSV